MNIHKLVNEIKNKTVDKKTFIVAIDGRSGSGKTSIANALKQNIPNAEIVHLDTYGMYEGIDSIHRVIDDLLDPMKRSEKERFLIVEGIFALTSELIPFYDYKIWVECPEKLGFERGLQRDIKLNGIDNSEKWLTYWLPKEREYISTENPQHKADFIIEGDVKQIT